MDVVLRAESSASVVLMRVSSSERVFWVEARSARICAIVASSMAGPGEEVLLGLGLGVPGRKDCFELLGEGAAASVEEGGGCNMVAAVRSASLVSDIHSQLSSCVMNR